MFDEHIVYEVFVVMFALSVCPDNDFFASGSQDADIFLTTHGFQSMALLFMKKGTFLLLMTC